tara:strand:- start:214 stop:492 length:279 start_codon:yes stop_codon:yes gene_type:complete
LNSFGADAGVSGRTSASIPAHLFVYLAITIIILSIALFGYTVSNRACIAYKFTVQTRQSSLTAGAGRPGLTLIAERDIFVNVTIAIIIPAIT